MLPAADARSGEQQQGIAHSSCFQGDVWAVPHRPALDCCHACPPCHPGRVRDNIVAAAEEIGLAACVTTVYSNGSAVAVEQRHAGIAAGAKETGKPSTPSDGFTGDGTLVQPDYHGGQTMQLAFDVKSSVQCKVWDERTLAFVPEGAPKGKTRVATACLLLISPGQPACNEVLPTCLSPLAAALNPVALGCMQKQTSTSTCRMALHIRCNSLAGSNLT